MKLIILHEYKKNAMPESELDLQNSIVEIAVRKGCLVTRISRSRSASTSFIKWKSRNVVSNKTGNVIWNMKGISDLQIITPNGVLIVMDLKKPNTATTEEKLVAQLSQDQLIYFHEIMRNGGLAVVCNSLNSFVNFTNNNYEIYQRQK